MSTFLTAVDEFDASAAGRRAYRLAQQLFPLDRSITGNGVRRTLEMVSESLQLGEEDQWQVCEVPSGEAVLDWTVPPEWNVREAWIKDPQGEVVVDFAEHNLHLLSYSVPVHRRVSLAELQEHLYSLPDQPELIPYRTSYYSERWGFCLPDRQRRGLAEGDYEVYIDASLEPGSLTYAELFLPGRSGREVLLSTHVCHPSLANDNLSGITTLTELANLLASIPPRDRRYGHRLLFVPGTIGAICWLAHNRDCAERVAHGLVCANLGDAGDFHYKKSRSGAPVDRAVRLALCELGHRGEFEEFSPFGYDERQYCSPGFDLPMGSLSRSPWGRYPQYHTSADDLAFLRADSLGESCQVLANVLGALHVDRSYRNLEPYGEPQLGRRGLYGSVGGGAGGRDQELARLWVLNLSDGRHSLLDIAERSDLPFAAVTRAARELADAGLLVEDDQHSD